MSASAASSLAFQAPLRRAAATFPGVYNPVLTQNYASPRCSFNRSRSRPPIRTSRTTGAISPPRPPTRPLILQPSPRPLSITRPRLLPGRRGQHLRNSTFNDWFDLINAEQPGPVDYLDTWRTSSDGVVGGADECGTQPFSGVSDYSARRLPGRKPQFGIPRTPPGTICRSTATLRREFQANAGTAVVPRKDRHGPGVPHTFYDAVQEFPAHCNVPRQPVQVRYPDPHGNKFFRQIIRPPRPSSPMARFSATSSGHIANHRYLSVALHRPISALAPRAFAAGAGLCRLEGQL